MMEPYLADLGGTGPYPHLGKYWQDPRRRPYLLHLATQPIGFALVEELDRQTNELVEFYVQASSRGQGLGRRAVDSLLHAHTGTWRVGVRKDNALGQCFWKALLGNLPSVAITEVTTPPALVYEFSVAVQ